MLASRFVFVVLVLLFGTGCCLEAQGPSGAYEMTNTDGSPIREGVRVGIDVGVEDGKIVGRVWVDTGKGKTPLPDETTTFTELGLSGIYEWTNARGTAGLLSYNLDKKRWESTTLTGPNAGTTRAWTPASDE